MVRKSSTTTEKTGTALDIERALRRVARSDKADFLPRFFQCHPGGYGEGDRFLGVVVPDQRRVAREFRSLPENEIRKLLGSQWHECRLTGLFILADQFQRSSEPDSTRIFELMLDCFTGVNNWDLVDTAGPKIAGPWLAEKKSRQKLLMTWAKFSQLWSQRLAMVSTLTLIKRDEYDWTTRLATKFLDHPHDLIHKATGWMLREMGNRSKPHLLDFLDRHATRMPRTMLRYAIEKLPEPMRQAYLKLR